MAADQVGRRIPGQRLAPNVTGQFDGVREPAAEPRPLHAKRWRFSDGENGKMQQEAACGSLAAWQRVTYVSNKAKGASITKESRTHFPSRHRSISQALVQLY
ncbi:hypothetical protein E4U49_003518 [Claviceps purpurea]|nr:hypothetical protein E4U49_003518 [Claviceps purpurea]